MRVKIMLDIGIAALCVWVKRNVLLRIEYHRRNLLVKHYIWLIGIRLIVINGLFR